MSFLFGGARATGADSIKAYANEARSNAREAEREATRVERQERELLSQIKRTGNIEEAKSKARELVRLRAHKGKLHSLRKNMAGLSMELKEVATAQKTEKMVRKTASMLHRMNRDTNAAATAQVIREFERQSGIMTMKRETMEDALDSAFEADGEEVAADEEVARVLEEAGSRLAGISVSAGGTGTAERIIQLRAQLDS